MLPVLSVDEIRAADLNSEFWGVPTRILMENAGAGVARIINEESRKRGIGKRVAVVAGSGGKAGDSFVAARHLINEGYEVTVYLVSKVIKHPDALENFNILRNLLKVRIIKYNPGMLFNEEIIIDGLLGTGVKGAPRGEVAEAIKSINNSRGFKVSIDVPSGVNPETGEVPGLAVKADVTITMAAVKPGLLKAKEYVGKLYIVNIGTPYNAFIAVGPGDVKIWFKGKKVNAKKGDGGRILIVTGSKQYVGAPWLTAMSAWASGADLVFLASPEAVLATRFSPEIIGIPLKGDQLTSNHIDELFSRPVISKCDVIVSGPGLGLSSDTEGFIERLVLKAAELGKPLILDADALKVLPRVKLPENLKLLLTPHLGEASILLNRRLGEAGIDERVNIALEISRKYKAVTLLKGPCDAITSPEGKWKIRIGVGHQDMSCGGTGDVLTGIAATAVFRSGSLFRGACIAAFVNAVAGEYAYLRDGKASPLNIIKYVPQILSMPLEFCRKLKEIRGELSS